MKKNIEIFNYKEMYRVHTIEDKDKNKELGDIISRSYFALYKFYDDNDLSLTKLTDNGKILHDPVFENDLTLAGLKFRYVVRHWFGLKSKSYGIIPKNADFGQKKDLILFRNLPMSRFSGT